MNIEKTKYVLLSHHQNAGSDHDIKIAKKKIKVNKFGMMINPNLRIINRD
jgi:hypothetical protein